MNALIFTDGGARAAFQVGILKALFEAEPNIDFQIVAGISAGSVNASRFVAGSNDPQKAIRDLEQLYRQLKPSHIFNSKPIPLIKRILGRLTGLSDPDYLLDNHPMEDHIRKNISENDVNKSLKAGATKTLLVTAFNHSRSISETFVFGDPGPHPIHHKNQLWLNRKVNRYQNSYTIASASIPVVFKPKQIEQDIYCDGMVRNHQPISPAVQAGATRILVIGTRAPEAVMSRKSIDEISPGTMFSDLLNSLFFDPIKADLSRIDEKNQLIESGGSDHLGKHPFVHYDWVRPRVDLDQVAGKYLHKLPTALRSLIPEEKNGDRTSSTLAGFLLFDGDYCGELIDLGYEQGQSQIDEMLSVLKTQEKTKLRRLSLGGSQQNQ